MDAFFWAWYGYVAILGILAVLSAGPRTLAGALASLATLAAAVLLISLALSLPRHADVTVTAKFGVVAGGIGAMVLARRSDTRHIALLITGSGALTLFLHYWRPSV